MSSSPKNSAPNADEAVVSTDELGVNQSCRQLSPIRENEPHDSPNHESVAKQDATTDDTKCLQSATDANKIKTISFHVDGDMIIQVVSGEQTLRYQVASACFATASPTWRVMLYKDMVKQRKNNGEWIVELKDDADALRILLYVIHYQFDQIPAIMSIDDLYSLVLTTSRYGCTHLIHPWTNKWTQALIDYCNNPRCPSTNDKVAWIAWNLGDINTFQDMVYNMIFTSKVNEHGDLTNPDGVAFKTLVLPPGILDIVTANRAKVLMRILKSLDDPIKNLSDPTRSLGDAYCKVDKSSHECETMMLGSAMQALIHARLFPVPEVQSFNNSINSLKSIVSDIKFTPFVGHKWAPHKAHEGCNLGFVESMKKCLDEMETPITIDHVLHLKKQAGISGIGNESQFSGYDLDEEEVAQADEFLRFSAAAKRLDDKARSGYDPIPMSKDGEVSIAKDDEVAVPVKKEED